MFYLFHLKASASHRFFKILILLLITASCRFQPQQKEATPTGVLAKNAMVVTAQPEASKVGITILKKGGNAIDAAVAVQFALAVVYPAAGNLGGGGFMVYRNAEGEVSTLDFREKAPISSSRDMYLDSLGKVVPRLSLDGHLAVGVPGTVEGCWQSHQRFGSMQWEQLLQPAIDLAENGFSITQKEADRLNKYMPDLEKFNAKNYFRKDTLWVEGDLFVQSDLAETLKLIQKNKRAGFYEGKVADLIVEEMGRGEGIITTTDLKNYNAIWRTPLSGHYKEYTIHSMAPPSSGGVCLMQILEMLEPLPLAEWGFQSSNSVHHIVEAERRAYADRATHLGDPGFYKIPINELLDSVYLNQRFKDVHPEKASLSGEVSAGNLSPVFSESEETTHFSIVDNHGNAVAVTTTLNSAYGSKVFVEGAGFLLNNEMDDFSIKPGAPNQYGLIGNEANAIEPGKRMLSSMTPTIVEKNDELFMVLGTPGGSTIITSVLQNFLNVAEFNMGMQESVDQPRFHHQWRPDTLFIEKETLSAEVRSQLKEKGHQLVERSSIGKVDAILVRENGLLEGGADPRGDDTAMGY